MKDFEIVEERYITIPEVKELLKGKKDMVVEEKTTKAYANRFSKFTVKKAQDLKDELQSLEDRRLTDEVITKIIDIAPQDEEMLKLILQMTKLSFKKEEISKIMNIIQKYM
ncbi:hypothetical protein DRN75_00335 [Nanoarchaeota archaeon]|nr:MAG: hypothetical protein DRN75_00335 [Nanoarchaeota archaeon]